MSNTASIVSLARVLHGEWPTPSQVFVAVQHAPAPHKCNIVASPASLFLCSYRPENSVISRTSLSNARDLANVICTTDCETFGSIVIPHLSLWLWVYPFQIITHNILCSILIDLWVYILWLLSIASLRSEWCGSIGVEFGRSAYLLACVCLSGDDHLSAVFERPSQDISESVWTRTRQFELVRLHVVYILGLHQELLVVSNPLAFGCTSVRKCRLKGSLISISTLIWSLSNDARPYSIIANILDGQTIAEFSNPNGSISKRLTRPN